MTDAQHAAERPLANGHTRIDFQTEPARYRHWKLDVDGDVATLLLDVDEKGALFEGYDLKLNSYDLGVDIELADAIERLRFEHPQVKVVVLRSGKPRVFCAGANIRMLAGASHAHKVNFCKFTNETRNGIEDLSEHSGLKTICAISGTAAGGGYELALAADHIMLVDDGSSAVALPELPLLAVLPGTGGLTRVADKRKVRRDHADVFCTTEEGVKGKRALDWRLVDEVTPGSKFDETIAARAKEFAAKSGRGRAASRRAASTMARSPWSSTGPRGSRPSRCADLRRRRPRRSMRSPRSPPSSGRSCSRASSTMRSFISGSTSSTLPRSCSNLPAIRRRLSPTSSSSMRTTAIGWCARSGTCGSGCSSVSISPRARWRR
jgi:benzoyl-CoA-dihydrodiol lyase